ncbi:MULTISPECIES: hypothetical protein [Acidobacterium]|uniref:Uncharacterized protein n=1 Tax=Acidobacterium capsulatum (strain ATCC 51196 / DSM 11244 / BCRC 80197 / JCM 7670 / NBRC 15755 / NCIMB 13165 / 161) TaxID=240015 RepID=C1F1Q8_ACIC5|nr:MULTISPECIES: hypothetical protein [Acidobacterium]ACO31366.1 hypothetical protein ACP_0666 [Acidobacterium capsulatum ATCC 51196]HCT60017.1 hypothetical protein [Acidobacterium sp.]
MSKAKRAILAVEEVVGKRIRRLCLEEPYPQARDGYLTIEFEDGTSLLIEVGCRSCFGITHLSRDTHGELAPAKMPMRGTIRSLARGKR